MPASSIIVLAVGLASLWFGYRWRRARDFPGPRRFPLIGNILSTPTSKPWLTYSAWRRIYGDLILLDGLGKHILVVNSMEHASELLDKRSSVYSDRPELPMADLTGSGGMHLAFLRYGNEWRTHRRLFQSRFRQGNIREDQDVISQKCGELLGHLLRTPDAYNEHIELYISSIILSIIYGREVLSHHDPLLAFVQAANNTLVETLLSGSLLNLFPKLQHIPSWVPGAGFKRRAKTCREQLRVVMDMPFDTVKADMAAGIARPSWALSLLQNTEMGSEAENREELMKSVTATGFSAAVETTVSTIRVFIQAMVLYPEIQKRAQVEIDSVLRNGRLPSFDDQDSLPYITALCREVRRWRPVLPLVMPHANVTDDIYHGHLMPKGTIILANVWEMCHDESIYDQPDEFLPERFLDKNGNLKKDTVPAFGFGRRICVGRYFAEAAIWIAAVSILAAFDITKAKDQNGRDIEVSADDYTDGATGSTSFQVFDYSSIESFTFTGYGFISGATRSLIKPIWVIFGHVDALNGAN